MDFRNQERKRKLQTAKLHHTQSSVLRVIRSCLDKIALIMVRGRLKIFDSLIAYDNENQGVVTSTKQ